LLQETPPSPEVATFTVFFMAFTAMVGKELLELDYAAETPGKTILSTYVPTSYDETASETAATDSLVAGDDDDSFKDAISEEEKEGVAEMKTSRPSMSGMFMSGTLEEDLDSESPMNGRTLAARAPIKENIPVEHGAQNDEVEAEEYQTPDEEVSTNGVVAPENTGEPRRRFRDSLSALQIEEAKATGRAQLGLAFEMLTMMKKRALKADPEAYQSLIDACGRVGDTKRATELLAKMHEDGIVADGTVYACLVSAFSAETAWKKGTKEEDLPGMFLYVTSACCDVSNILTLPLV
jgi:pentatricopeptide repeat protein